MTEEEYAALPGVKRARVIGGQVLLQGNCLEVMPGLGRVDAVLTDPPYSVSFAGKSSSFKRIGNKGTRNYNFFEGDADWLAMRSRVTESVKIASSLDPLSLLVWCGHRQFGEIVETFEAKGYKTRFLVWRKLCPPPAPPGAGFASGAELAVYAYRSGRAWNGTVNENNVFLADAYRHGNPGKVNHPTQKPLSLIEWNVNCLTNRSDIVLDCFAGSGTTLVACQKLGRRGIGIELDPDYWEIACKRVEEAARQPDLFVKPTAPAPQQEGFDL